MAKNSQQNINNVHKAVSSWLNTRNYLCSKEFIYRGWNERYDLDIQYYIGTNCEAHSGMAGTVHITLQSIIHAIIPNTTEISVMETIDKQ